MTVDGKEVETSYFSDRQGPPPPRTRRKIPSLVRGWIFKKIEEEIANESFSYWWPQEGKIGDCLGTNRLLMARELGAELPFVEWPWLSGRRGLESLAVEELSLKPPATEDICDLVEFFHRRISYAGIDNSLCGEGMIYYTDREGRMKGQEGFRTWLNRLFQRHGLVYKLGKDSKIRTVGHPVLRVIRDDLKFNTPDQKLNEDLEAAWLKCLSPKLEEKKTGLTSLSMAWEYTLSLLDHEDKEKATDLIFGEVANIPLRAALKKEAKGLWNLWNQVGLRHGNSSKEKQDPITDPEQADYLYFRLMALIYHSIRLLWPPDGQ